MSLPLAIGQMGAWEWILVLAVFLLLFGSSKLPKLARSLGASLTEFKKGLKGEAAPEDEEERKKLKDTAEKPKAGQPE